MLRRSIHNYPKGPDNVSKTIYKQIGLPSHRLLIRVFNQGIPVKEYSDAEVFCVEQPDQPNFQYGFCISNHGAKDYYKKPQYWFMADGMVG